MIVTIDLENMEFHANHGCYDTEKLVGNRFRVDLSLDAEIGDAAQYDDLSSSVNYVAVYELVRGQMAVAADIIENVAWRIGESVKEEFPQVKTCRVKVAKLAPPVGGKVEKIAVTIVK